MTPRATEIASVILHMCDSGRYRTQAGLYVGNIVDEVGDADDVESVIDDFLVPMNYIKENKQTKGYYSITELGKNHIRRSSGASGMSFGNNTNLAINSPNAQQSVNIDVSIYNQEVQDKISQLQEAVRDGDKSKFKSAIGYILDKGVDIAIVLTLAQAGLVK